MKINERTIWITLLILMSVFIFHLIHSNNLDGLMHRKQINAKNSENLEYRNKYKELVSEKLAFVGEKKQLKEEIDYWKKQGDTLRSKITSKTQQIIFLKKKIEIVGTGHPIFLKKDTSISIANILIDTAIIAIDTADNYHSFKFAGNKKKYAYQIGITDNTELVTEDLGKNGTLVQVVNRNPYVLSSEAKSVIVEPKKKPSMLIKIIWFTGGALIGCLAFR